MPHKAHHSVLRIDSQHLLYLYDEEFGRCGRVIPKVTVSTETATRFLFIKCRRSICKSTPNARKVIVACSDGCHKGTAQKERLSNVTIAQNKE